MWKTSKKRHKLVKKRYKNWQSKGKRTQTIEKKVRKSNKVL